jgi:tetratricopeptide (TPR) repeat protein
MDNLAQQAISAALAGKWDLARKLNREILKQNSKDTDALNRLAKAYAQLGEVNKAQKTSQKVLKLDPYNKIGQKSLEKWKQLRPNTNESQVKQNSSPPLFLEEPGKTKLANLINLGSPKVIANLDSGDEVKLICHKHRVSVTTIEAKYIGRLSDDLAALLRKLIRCGNGYQTLIKSADKSRVQIFIKEIKRGEKMANIPSFSGEKIDFPSVLPPDLVPPKVLAKNA